MTHENCTLIRFQLLVLECLVYVEEFCTPAPVTEAGKVCPLHDKLRASVLAGRDSGG